MIRIEAAGFSAYTPRAGKGWVGRPEAARWPALAVPELGNGFLYANAAENVTEELCEETFYSFRVDMPKQGNYLVRLCVKTPTEGGHWQVFCQNRRLVHHCNDGVKASERIFTFAISLRDIVPDSVGERQKRNGISITLTGGAQLLWMEIGLADIPTLHIAGDSTVTDQPAGLPYRPGASYCGWGQMLPAFLGSFFAVNNQAHSGMTVELFRRRGHWEILREAIRPKDLVLVQFGHNDQKEPHLQAWGGYVEGLWEYIEDIRRAGAMPVLVTSLARNSWLPNGGYNDLLAPYVEAMNGIAQEMDVPLLDLHGAFGTAISSVGCNEAKALFYPGDFTHTNDYGAFAAAKLLCGLIRDNGHTGLAKLREVVKSDLPDLLPTAEELDGRCCGWFSAPAPKVQPVTKLWAPAVSRLDALALAASAFGFFAVVEPPTEENEEDNTTEPEPVPVTVARQNGYWPPAFDKGDIAQPVAAAELIELLAEACKARASVPQWLVDSLPRPKNPELVTIEEATAIAALLEEACIGASEKARTAGIEVAGS